MRITGARIARIAAALVALLLLAVAGSASVRIFLAERLIDEATLEKAEQAARLAPSNSNAWARVGALKQRQGDGGGATLALERSLALDRYNSHAWIQLGLHWESENDPKRAEACFLEAARVDNTYYPRWSLANFYLRHPAGDAFWKSMREAISRNRENLPAAFDLYWRASTTPEEILEKGIPDDPVINREYFVYLLNSGELPFAAAAWERIENGLQPKDVPIALHYTEILRGKGEVAAAVAVWDHLCAARLLKFDALEPDRGKVLTNGNFASAPSGAAFDWSVQKVDGVTSTMEVEPGGANGLRLSFNGAHPEETPLLGQWMPVEPGQSYFLSFRYSTDRLPDETGLFWKIQDAAGKDLGSSRPLAATAEGEWKQDTSDLRTASDTRVLHLVFYYRRAPGTTRAQGSVALRQVDVSPLRQKAAGNQAPVKGRS